MSSYVLEIFKHYICIFFFIYMHLYIESCPKDGDSEAEISNGTSLSSIRKPNDDHVTSNKNKGNTKSTDSKNEENKIINDFTNGNKNEIKDNLLKIVDDYYGNNLVDKLRIYINKLSDEGAGVSKSDSDSLKYKLGYYINKNVKNSGNIGNEVVCALVDIILKGRGGDIKEDKIVSFIKNLDGNSFYFTVNYEDFTYLFVCKNQCLIDKEVLKNIDSSSISDYVIEKDELVRLDKSREKLLFCTELSEYNSKEDKFVLFLNNLLQLKTISLSSGKKDMIFDIYRFKNSKHSDEIVISSNITNYYIKANGKKSSKLKFEEIVFSKTNVK